MAQRAPKPKVRISITVSPDLLRWVEERVGAGKPFGSVSHAFESGVVALQKERSRKE